MPSRTHGLESITWDRAAEALAAALGRPAAPELDARARSAYARGMVAILCTVGVLTAFAGALLPPLQALFPRISLVTYQSQRGVRLALTAAGLALQPSGGAWACGIAALLLGLLSELFLVPRALIPPLDDPPAARTAPAPGLVMGIEAGGSSHAYPLALLIAHHIVNETVGGVAVVATFCPACRSGAVFDATVEGRRLRFEAVSVRRRNMVMRDRETGTVWQQETGEALRGPFGGRSLRLIGGEISDWEAWRAEHPGTTVCVRPPGYRHPHPLGRHFETLLDRGPRHLVGPGLHGLDRRLDQHAEIAGVVVAGVAKAYPLELLRDLGTIDDLVGTVQVRLTFDTRADRVRAALGSTPVRVSREWWLAWSEYHPGTGLYGGERGGT